MLNSNLAAASKLGLVLEFDEVLGFGLREWLEQHREVPEAIAMRLQVRQLVRHASRGVYVESDHARATLETEGFRVLDEPATSRARFRGTREPVRRPGVITSLREIQSQLHQPDTVEFSINLLAWDNADEIERGVAGILKHCGDHSIEIVLIDNGSSDGTAEVVQRLANEHPEIKPLWIDHWVGEGAGRNAGLMISTGRIVIMLGNHIEVNGDIFTPIAQALSDPEVGVCGGWGITSGDLRTFESSPGPDVDVVEAYLMAFRRSDLNRVGLLDEKFRFYRHVDLEFSLRFSDRGQRLIILPELKARTIEHEHRLWYGTPPDERERKSKRNFYRFLHRWGDRRDLLLQPTPIHYHADDE
jgi:cysteinyl-tRNA synthetase